MNNLGVAISDQLYQTILELPIPENKIVRQLSNFEIVSDKVDFLDVDIENKEVVFTFLPKSRVKKIVDEAKKNDPYFSDESLYFRKERQSAKIGKTIKKILMYEVDDLSVREFVETLSNSWSKEDYKIIVVQGKDIRPYYLEKNYVPGENSELHKSCLRYDRCQEWLGIYEANENLQLVAVLDDNDKVLARAFVWNNLELTNEFNTKAEIEKVLGKSKDLRMMDRIYPANPKVKNYLWKWGLSNCDLLHKYPRRLNIFSTPNGEVLNYVALKQEFKGEYKYHDYPWIDTLQYFDIGRKEFNNFQRDFYTEGGLQFNNNEGSFSRLNTITPTLKQIREELNPTSKKSPKLNDRTLEVLREHLRGMDITQL